jgi:multicomponent Na+:H+ antiporter subunit F
MNGDVAWSTAEALMQWTMGTMDWLATVALTLLMITVALAFVRLYKGPSLPDRVVALDLLTTVGIAVAAVYAVIIDQPAILDVATILALISFLGTIAFAYYVDLME